LAAANREGSENSEFKDLGQMDITGDTISFLFIDVLAFFVLNAMFTSEIYQNNFYQ